jgi:hypothetical protein
MNPKCKAKSRFHSLMMIGLGLLASGLIMFTAAPGHT